MKKNILFRIVLTMIIVVVSAACCKKDDPVSPISPPKWIQGEWEWSLVDEDSFTILTYLFTSNDLIMTAKMDAYENPIKYVISDMANSNNLWTVTETIKTDETYEITLTGPAQTVYHFKKGDGTYIEIVTNEILMRLNKK